VATLSVLRQVNAPPALRNCIFGEATLNDALSIVLFKVIKEHVSDFEAEEFVSSIGCDIVYMLLGSMLAGGAFSLVGAYVTRRLLFLRLSAGRGSSDSSEGHSREPMPHVEISLVATIALFTYAAAERLGLSGIMALFVGGAMTRHYTFHNLSEAAQESSTSFFLTLSSLAETSLATLLGVAGFDYLALGARDNLDTTLGRRENHMIDLSFAVATLPVLFLARALNIFPLSQVANSCRPAKKHITLPMQTVMWFSGNRGALSFALAVTLNDPHSPVSRFLFHQIVAATLMTIAVTTLLMAPCTPHLINSLHLGVPDKGLVQALLDVESPGVHRRSPPSAAGAPSGTSFFAVPPFELLLPGPPTPIAETPKANKASMESLDSDDEPKPIEEDSPTKVGSSTHVRRVLRRLEQAYLKPIFGGRGAAPLEDVRLPEAAWGFSLFFTPWDKWKGAASEPDLQGRLRLEVPET